VVDLTDQMTDARPVDHSPDRSLTGPDQPPAGHAPDALVALLERQTHQIAELSAAAALWQERARFLGEQLRAIEAGPIAGEVSPDAPQERNPAPLRDDVPYMAPEALSKPFEAPDWASDRLALGWRRWWRRITGH